MGGLVGRCLGRAWTAARAREGALPALIKNLKAPRKHVQEQAAGALRNLAVNPGNKTRIVD